MNSGLIDLWFRRKVKKGLESEAGVSSRYLDSGTEDAILGRSLLHKNHNDEFLRCTEFDRSGMLHVVPPFSLWWVLGFLLGGPVGNVTVVSGEFKKNELCAKVRLLLSHGQL